MGKIFFGRDMNAETATSSLLLRMRISSTLVVVEPLGRNPNVAMQFELHNLPPCTATSAQQLIWV